MLTLLLLRHAKSCWDDPALADIDRPLAPRGIKAAPLMGRQIKRLGLDIDLVLCSSATRARQTWALVQPELVSADEAAITVIEAPELYHATSRDLETRLRAVPPDHRTLLLIGHNPAFDRLANQLVGSGDTAERERMRRKFPTAALAMIGFAGDDWSMVKAKSGRLEGFWRPKDEAVQSLAD